MQNKIKMVCLECGKKKDVSPNAKTEPRCSCGSVDLDVVDTVYIGHQPEKFNADL
jgi:endogenous inhibitor of DNA gyrase (YacG/DUF329 family)